MPDKYSKIKVAETVRSLLLHLGPDQQNYRYYVDEFITQAAEKMSKSNLNDLRTVLNMIDLKHMGVK